MTRVDWPRVDASLAELFDSAAIDAAVDEGLRLGDLRFRRTLRLLQAVAAAAVVVVTGAALMLQGSVHAEPESAPPPPPPSHALPVVQSVSPVAGSHEGGQTVSVTGLHLAGAQEVLFGETAVSDLLSVSDRQVVVVSPPHPPGTVAVAVVADEGTSRAAPGATYTFLRTPPSTLPVLATITPDAGPPSGGTEVTIVGTRVADATSVAFGEARVDAASFRDVTDTAITVLTPAHAPGTVEVTVTTDAGTSAPLEFTYTRESPAPTDEIPVVKSVDPSSGSVDGGEEVTISGANLADATTVEFGGVEATISAQDEGTITVTTPEHEAGEVAVVVTGPAGDSADSRAARYTYLAGPTVTGIEPGIGPTGGGQQVTIRGTDLAGATAVSFGGVEVTAFTDVSDGSLTVATPGHAPGRVEVIVSTPGGTASGGTYVYADPPTVTALDPPDACPSQAPTVTIDGSGFAGPDGPWVQHVVFGNRVAAIDQVGADRITVVAPVQPPGTLVSVVVTTPAGSSAGDDFIYKTACIEQGPG